MAEANDDMEMKKERSEQEAGEQEGEDETNVDDDQRRDESILVPDGSNPNFKRVGVKRPEGSFPDPKRDMAAVKRSETTDKKNFIKEWFKISVNKTGGTNSKKLLEKLRIVHEDGKTTGATYGVYHTYR